MRTSFDCLILETTGSRTAGVSDRVAKTPLLWFDDRMSTTAIEQELHELKKRVEALEQKEQIIPNAAWRGTVGFAKDDELFDEAMRLGAEWRAKANHEGQ